VSLQTKLNEALAAAGATKTLVLDGEADETLVLPDTIGGLKILTELRVRRARVAMVPDALAKLTKLETLDLSGNALTKLPAAVGKLASLRALVVADNALEELPREIGFLRKLETLDVAGNKLRLIPTAFGQLKLKTLRLGRNELLPTRPDGNMWGPAMLISQYKKLEVLELDANLLEDPPENLRELELLKEVRVHGGGTAALQKASTLWPRARVEGG